jgi:poly-gamma-glutamate synthesis protein (capsule biosynthesis protein)
MSCANNHGFDYGEQGVLTNIRSLDSAGVVHAGSGRNYADAVAPAYLDTERGRVALVSGTTSARLNSRAGEQRRDMNGRPGLNVLRWAHEWSVDQEAFDTLRRTSELLGWATKPPDWWSREFKFDVQNSERTLYFADRNLHGLWGEDPAARFVLSDRFEKRTFIHHSDFQRNVESVLEARRMADWVIFSIHNHEGGATEYLPSDHVRTLAHGVIDAGADVVVGHGPHMDRGIEIYNGKPIFYSLGNFIMQNETVERQPHDAMTMWGLDHTHAAADLYDARSAAHPAPLDGDPHGHSGIPIVTFDDGQLVRVELHPIEVGYTLPRSQAGRPMLADGRDAEHILRRLQGLSESLGTTIDIADNVGLVVL